jgi:hypothetical protein
VSGSDLRLRADHQRIADPTVAAHRRDTFAVFSSRFVATEQRRRPEWLCSQQCTDPSHQANPDWMSSLLWQHRLMSPVRLWFAFVRFNLTSWLDDLSLLVGLPTVFQLCVPCCDSGLSPHVTVDSCRLRVVCRSATRFTVAYMKTAAAHVHKQASTRLQHDTSRTKHLACKSVVDCAQVAATCITTPS